MRTIITNGHIIDGSGRPTYRADLLLEDDRISALLPASKQLDEAHQTVRMHRPGHLPHGADLLIDAGGLTVTPGFIDSHRHGDLAVLTDPAFGELELAQGITSVVNGNCGLSFVPNSTHTRQSWFQFLEPCLGQAPAGLQLSEYETFLAATAAAQPRVNVATLIGTGAIRMAVKGLHRSSFTAAEMDRAVHYLDDAMQAGAPGVSCGIMYVPECYTTADEYVAMLSPLAAHDRVLSCHLRGEGDSLLDAVREILSICRRTGIRLNISHFKSFGIKNWQKMIHQAIEEIEKSGLDVTSDFYPYLGGSTTLMTLLPPAVIADTLQQTLQNIAGPAGAAAVKAELEKKHAGWDNMVSAVGWERIMISAASQPEHADYLGKSMAELAGQRGVDPVTLLCELLVKENGNVSIINMCMDQADSDAVARLPWSMIVSDSLYSKGGKPHPRLYGAFAKAIRDLVFQRRVLSLEEAIRKMTSQPAARYGLKERGLIREGFFADLCLFDPARLRDRATYAEPCLQAEGMDLVLVNGQIARASELTDESVKTGKRSGRILLNH